MTSLQARHARTDRGLGLAVMVPEESAARAAAATQASGYHSFWLNNIPGRNALPVLGRIAPGTSIWLGVGVIPLSDRSPDAIVQDVRQYSIPQDRLYLGIGSGGAGAAGLERVARGVEAIEAELEAQVVVAALGPRMCRLAGERADGVLLNWLTPEHAVRSGQWIREAAEAANRPVPRIMAYVRVGLGADAIARLEREAENYERSPAYAANRDRMGTGLMGTAVAGHTPAEIQEGLSAWDGVVDEVVVRAITATDEPDEILRLVEAAAPSSSSR